jgi:long-chain acyl-CoA synthetase
MLEIDRQEAIVRGTELAWPAQARGSFVRFIQHALKKYPDQRIDYVIRYAPETQQPIGYQLRYRELDEASRRCAGALRGLGIRHGDRIALMLPNSPEYFIVFLGALRIGAIAVPVNTAYTGPEIKTQLNDAGASLLVMPAAHYSKWEAIRNETPSVRHVLLADPFQASGRNVYQSAISKEGAVTAYSLTDLFGQPSTKPIRTAAKAEDIALLPYTGGTTGIPKGVMLTHRNLIAIIQQGACWLNEGSNIKKILAVLPLSHTYGLGIMLTAISQGKSLVAIPNLGGDQDFMGVVVNAILRERPDILFGVPTIFKNLWERLAACEIKLEKPLLALSRGARLPQPIAEALRSWGIDLIEGYGLTEASSNVTTPIGRSKPGSVGLPMAGVEAKVIDRETMQDLARGDTGELVIRGPNRMKGYWQKDQATLDALLPDDWLRTGDLARIDEDGYVHIVGRIKEMIITGGENVYPIEVEAVLLQHPKVAEAAVVGVPDSTWGEMVTAFVVLKPGETTVAEELITFAKSRLASFKVPKKISIIEELPRTFLGKIQKYKLLSSL